MKNYNVVELNPEQVSSILSQMKSPGLAAQTNPFKREHRAMLLSGGLELRGQFGLVARNIETGEIEWEHKQDNLVTDYGRMMFASNGWSQAYLGFIPSREQPSIGRIAVATDANQSFISNARGAGTVTAVTYTRTYGPITSATAPEFGAPASNRTLGTVFLTQINSIGNYGPAYLLAYSLLSPPKVQTTVQTVELNYTISMNPIV